MEDPIIFTFWLISSDYIWGNLTNAKWKPSPIAYDIADDLGIANGELSFHPIQERPGAFSTFQRALEFDVIARSDAREDWRRICCGSCFELAKPFSPRHFTGMWWKRRGWWQRRACVWWTRPRRRSVKMVYRSFTSKMTDKRGLENVAKSFASKTIAKKGIRASYRSRQNNVLSYSIWDG